MALGLLVTSAGWYLSASAGSDQRLDSCRFEEETLVLTYEYGASFVVSPTVDMTGRDVIVALHVDVGGGPAPAIALHGEARFQIFGEPRTVRYADGEVLECSQSQRPSA